MMPTDENVKEDKARKKDSGIFGSMSGIQKALLIIFAIAIFFIVWTFVFGGIQNFYQFIMFAISFFAIGGLFYIVLTMVAWYLAPEYYSPKRDFFTRIVNLSIDLKPTNVNDLYFMGDKDKQRVKAGKIVGLLGIPYLIGIPKKHLEDKYEDEKLVAKKGEPIFEYSTVLKRKIPVFEKIEYGKDGDTLFVYEAGWILKRRHYLRCHRSLHGDLHGDVIIADINPVPYGTLYEYPFKQLQREPARIMMQNQLEVILATSEHHLDLISQGVDAAVYFNPAFRILQKQQAEMTAQT